MKYETLKFDIDQGLGIITLNRPEAANAINIPMAKDLLNIAIECEGGAPVRSLLLKSEGKLFCAGGDLKFISELDNIRSGLAEMLGYLHAALGKIDHLDTPLVGAISGTAAGAGLSLVSACDLAIAGERDQLDQMIKENPFMVNMMVFFKVTDLPTLSRLNLRFLLEGKHLCYKCKKELGRLMQKFTVSDVRKFNFKLPRGMTTRDDLCADCFNNLTKH